MSERIKAWSIGVNTYGHDGKGSATFIMKKVFATEQEAKDAVFLPYEVRPMEIDLEAIREGIVEKLRPDELFIMKRSGNPLITGK